MRNVNFTHWKMLLKTYEFYINYEECKSNIIKATVKGVVSFILTMRNVNE